MAISILVAAVLQAAPAAHGPLDWLAQEWACRAEMRAGGPVWRVLKIERDGRGLAGRFGWERTVAGGRAAEPGSRMSIAGGILRLTHAPDYDVATQYRQVRNDAEGAVFETRARVMPQRVVFRRSSFRLTVTMSQLDGSVSTSTSYSPPGLHTGIGSCDGSR